MEGNKTQESQMNCFAQQQKVELTLESAEPTP